MVKYVLNILISHCIMDMEKNVVTTVTTIFKYETVCV